MATCGRSLAVMVRSGAAPGRGRGALQRPQSQLAVAYCRSKARTQREEAGGVMTASQQALQWADAALSAGQLALLLAFLAGRSRAPTVDSALAGATLVRSTATYVPPVQAAGRRLRALAGLLLAARWAAVLGIAGFRVAAWWYGDAPAAGRAEGGGGAAPTQPLRAEGGQPLAPPPRVPAVLRAAAAAKRANEPAREGAGLLVAPSGVLVPDTAPEPSACPLSGRETGSRRVFDAPLPPP